MNSRALSGPIRVTTFPFFMCFSKKVFNHTSADGKLDNWMEGMDGPLKQLLLASDSSCPSVCTPILNEVDGNQSFKGRHQIVEKVRIDAQRVLGVLQQSSQELDTQALKELRLRVSDLLMREVLWGIFRSADQSSRRQCARLGFKFFAWCGKQENYRHTTQGYHLMMKFLAACKQFKAVRNLFIEMTEKGFPTTAQTLNILICASGEDGQTRKEVERLLNSYKTFNFKPFKHSYNAILHCLVTVNWYEFELIGRVYHQMLADGCSPDLFTHSVLFCAKYRLGKTCGLLRLLDEMRHPDTHTCNISLHVHGKTNEPGLALNLLNQMKEIGIDPSVLHFTNLLDGLSRAKNLDACKCLFGMMIKDGCVLDVVFYTVMITGYVKAHELSRAKKLFNFMTIKGKLPNVFTYNSMLRGHCVAGEFAEACTMLGEMESRRCYPNLFVYKTLKGYVNRLIHVLGKQNKLGLAINLLNGTKEVGLHHSISLFTLLLDGLRKAKNLDACKIVFCKMIKNGCMHDVVSYTVMITAYMVAGELHSAKKTFAAMISQGKLPTEATYISMIQGFCMAGKFVEAHSILDKFDRAYSAVDENGCFIHIHKFYVYKRLGRYINNAEIVCKLRKSESI